MTDQQTPPPAVFNLHQVYVKDISFESPSSPGVFTWSEYKPETEVNLEIQHRQLDADKNLYEVVLKSTVTARHQQKTVFLAEAQQGGVFTVKGGTDELQELMLEAACPNVLFPFLRETIAQLVLKGGFPQLLLSPVNFDAMYMQKKTAPSQAAAGNGDPAPSQGD